jgi:DnaJ homolog subfamily B member 4
VLSDPEKRKIYDQFGLEYLLRGGPPPPTPGGGGRSFEGAMPGGFQSTSMPGGGTRTYRFSTGPGGADGGFNFSNPEDIFSSFKSTGGMGFDEDFINILHGGFGGTGGAGAGAGAGARAFRTAGGAGPGFAQQRRVPTPEPSVVEMPLALTLEELFHGTTKKVVTKSKAFDQSGKRSVQEITLEASIKPGMRVGSKLKYRGVGDQEEGGRQDVHLIITEVSACWNTANPISKDQRMSADWLNRRTIQTLSAAATISSLQSSSVSNKPSLAGSA